ncbi:MFS transporter [Xanthobacter dioxanivorans]|uniref:MFS transporter n=1 Tax=Xanthobacter dioxanivorans TaxID=2528964 RepID=A0A974SJ38_9HYPH|nr:MFS transporter [Xanthobacter dioxanivorans]QRG06834.1 MFS transporter [Xanthobacter dioxanivorans]
MRAQGVTPPGGGALFPLAVTITIQALVSLASLAAPVMAPAAARTTGLAAEMVGLFVGIAYATASLSSLVSGDMVRRWGAIRMSQVSLLLCALGLSAAATGTPAMILLAAVLIGLGYGPVTPASSHILVRTTPRHRMGLTFSLKQTGVPLGGMLAGLFLPPLIGGLGWQMAALVVAGLCVVATIVTQSIRARLDDDRDPARAISAKAPLRALQLVLTTPAIRDMGVCSFFFGAMQLCLTTFLVIYLTTAQGMGLALAGTILAVAQVAGVAGRIGWGWLSDRFIPPRRLLGLLGLAMGAAGMTFAAAGTTWPVAAFMLLAAIFGASAIGWNGVFLAEVANLAPAGQAATVSGASLFITYAGVVVGPPAFAQVVARTDSFSVAYLAIGSVMVLVGLFLILTRSGPSRRPQPI